jgi:hypothetical protein
MKLFNQEEYDTAKSVAGRVAAIEDTNSPLMQRAQTRAAQQANQLGLRNSSIAVGAAQNAVLDAATPIATADAGFGLEREKSAQQASQFDRQLGESGRQFDTGEANRKDQFGQQLKESGRQFDTGEGNRLKLAADQLDEGARQFGESLGLERQKVDQSATQFSRNLAENSRQFDAGQLNQRTLAQMDADNRIKLAEIQYGNQSDIASNENISRAWATTMENINRLQNNPDLDAAKKKTLIDNQINGFQSFTNFWKKVGGGAVDVSDLLSFGVSSAGPAAAAPAPAPYVAPPPDNYVDQIYDRN